jgi:hypothetical protein
MLKVYYKGFPIQHKPDGVHGIACCVACISQVFSARVQPTSHHCWQRKVIFYLFMILTAMEKVRLNNAAVPVRLPPVLVVIPGDNTAWVVVVGKLRHQVMKGAAAIGGVRNPFRDSR